MTVFAAALIIAVVSYFINANKIDDYFKGLSLDSAKNFSTMVDADYLKRLKTVAESDEFQALREEAEKEDNEQIIEDYLRQKDLWEGY